MLESGLGVNAWDLARHGGGTRVFELLLGGGGAQGSITFAYLLTFQLVFSQDYPMHLAFSEYR